MENKKAYTTKTTLATIGIFIIIILAYGIMAQQKLWDPFLFPTLGDIGKSFQENWQVLFRNMVESFRLLFPSMLVALILSLGIGTFLGLNKRWRAILLPVVYTLSVIPSILLSPFALILAPSFKAASLFMIVYSTMWPTTFATITGITTIDKRYLDTADTLELSGFKRLFRVVLPAAMPSILSGFVSSLRGSFTILVFAEMYGAEFGMGYFIKKNANFGLYSNVWSGFIFMVIILVAVLYIFEKVKDMLLYWTLDE